MGVNCTVRLNDGANWKKVGQVACVLLGAKVSKEPLGNNPGSYHAVVEWFGYGQFKPTGTPEYVDILVKGADDNPLALDIAKSDAMPYYLWYGLENRSLYPKATAAKIALAEGITKFFGGRCVYNDCTDKKRTFPSPLSFVGESDTAFYRYQDALLALKPLTQADIDRCQKYAAY